MVICKAASVQDFYNAVGSKLPFAAASALGNLIWSNDNLELMQPFAEAYSQTATPDTRTGFERSFANLRDIHERDVYWEGYRAEADLIVATAKMSSEQLAQITEHIGQREVSGTSPLSSRDKTLRRIKGMLKAVRPSDEGYEDMSPLTLTRHRLLKRTNDVAVLTSLIGGVEIAKGIPSSSQIEAMLDQSFGERAHWSKLQTQLMYVASNSAWDIPASVRTQFVHSYFEFASIFSQLPITQEIVAFAGTRGISIDFGHDAHFFPYDTYKLREGRDTAQARAYRDQLRQQPVIIEKPVTHKPGDLFYHLNPLVFLSASDAHKLGIRIFADLFAGGGQWSQESRNTAFAVGNNSILTTGAMTVTLADRIRFMTAKWHILGEEDRISWIKGDFTNSADGASGHYDVVRLLENNNLVG